MISPHYSETATTETTVRRELVLSLKTVREQRGHRGVRASAVDIDGRKE